MSRILLADDSPHAQRMGERILREEGFEVVSLTDGDTTLVRLQDVDPDLIIADAFLPRKSGFEICRYVKGHPAHRHVRVILTAGLLEQLNEQEATGAGCDAILKKPFEASLVLATIKPLLRDAEVARGQLAPAVQVEPPPPEGEVRPEPMPLPQESLVAAEPVAAQFSEPDPERVRAAITLALDAALPALIQEITERVLVALGPRDN